MGSFDCRPRANGGPSCVSVVTEYSKLRAGNVDFKLYSVSLLLCFRRPFCVLLPHSLRLGSHRIQSAIASPLLPFHGIHQGMAKLCHTALLLRAEDFISASAARILINRTYHLKHTRKGCCRRACSMACFQGSTRPAAVRAGTAVGRTGAARGGSLLRSPGGAYRCLDGSQFTTLPHRTGKSRPAHTLCNPQHLQCRRNEGTTTSWP